MAQREPDRGPVRIDSGRVSPTWPFARGVPLSIKPRCSPALAVPILLVGTGLASAPPSPPPSPRVIAAVQQPPPSYAVRVTNRSQRAVTVYALLGGTPLRLGRVHPGRVERLPTSCSHFLRRETDFELRSVAGRYRLEGETIGDCGQTIEIEVLPIGLEFSRVRIIRDPPPGRGG